MDEDLLFKEEMKRQQRALLKEKMREQRALLKEKMREQRALLKEKMREQRAMMARQQKDEQEGKTVVEQGTTDNGASNDSHEGGCAGSAADGDAADGDELYEAALEVVRRTHRASTSSLQRALRIGYTRAARLIDRMEEEGIVGPPCGADPREILIDLDGEFPASPKGVEVSGDAAVMVLKTPAETSEQEDSFDSVARTPITPVPVPKDSMEEGFSVSRRMRTAIHDKFSALKEEMGTDPSLLPWGKIAEKLRASSNLKTGGCVMPEFLNVGRLLLEKEGGASPFGKDMDELFRQEDFPCLLRFRDQPGICFSGKSDDLALQAQLCVLRLLLSVNPNNVKFTLVDLATLGRAMNLLSPLRSVLNCTRVTQDNEIESFLRKLLTLVGDRSIETLSRYDWLWQYNEDNPAVSEPYHVVMLASGKEGIGVESAKMLERLIQKGNACRTGVYFILCDQSEVKSDGTDAQSREQIDSIWRSCQHDMGHVIVEADKTEVYQKGWIDTRDDGSFADFRMESVTPPPIIRDEIQQKIITYGKSKKVDNVPDLVSMSEADWWRQDSRKGLTVPIGLQEGGELQYFKFGGETVGALLGGATGTGKSALLHNLILGAARLYSPAELRMHLLDYKGGTEFVCYRMLPHVENLSIGLNVEFGLDVLNELSKEMERRWKVFQDADVDSVTAYREKTGLPMPRHLVVIDEFQVLWIDEMYGEQAKIKMTDLVRRGRTAGINFVLSTQTMKGVSFDAATKNNIKLRICLRLVESDCEDFLSPGNMVAASFSEPGEAVYNESSGQRDGNVRFRAAYLGDTWREIAKKIIGKLKELALEKGIQVARPNIYEGDKFVPLSVLSKEVRAGFLCVGRTNGIRPVPVGIPLEGNGFRVLAIVGRKKEKRETVFQTVTQQFAKMGVKVRELGDGSLKEETERWRRWNEGLEPVGECPCAYVIRDIDRLRDVRDFNVQSALGGMINKAPKGASSLLLIDAARYYDLTRALNVNDTSAMTGLLLLDEYAVNDAASTLFGKVRLGDTQGCWTGPGMEDGRKVALATCDS